MEEPKLDRSRHHKINAHQADQFRLWEGFQDRHNVTVRDHAGNDVLTVFQLTDDQLAELYLEIAQVLGRTPEPTVHHLKQVHDRIGRLIDSAKPKEEGWAAEF